MLNEMTRACDVLAHFFICVFQCFHQRNYGDKNNGTYRDVAESKIYWKLDATCTAFKIQLWALLLIRVSCRHCCNNRHWHYNIRKERPIFPDLTKACKKYRLFSNFWFCDGTIIRYSLTMLVLTEQFFTHSFGEGRQTFVSTFLPCSLGKSEPVTKLWLTWMPDSEYSCSLLKQAHFLITETDRQRSMKVVRLNPQLTYA